MSVLKTIEFDGVVYEIHTYTTIHLSTVEPKVPLGTVRVIKSVPFFCASRCLEEMKYFRKNRYRHSWQPLLEHRLTHESAKIRSAEILHYFETGWFDLNHGTKI